MSSDSGYYCYEYDDQEAISAEEVREFLHRQGAGWAECRLDDGWTRFLASCPLPGACSQQFRTIQAAARELDEIRALGGTVCGAWEDGH